MEGDDDRRLDVGIEKRAKAEVGHPFHQHFAIPRIALQSRRLPAFRGKLIERCIERYDDMRWRREAPLRRLFHVRPLVVEIESERRRTPRALFQHQTPDKNETHTRRALDAFAGCADQRVERCGVAVDRQCAE